MKSTGVVRRTDNLGRIVLPVELRRILHIHPKDAVEIFTEGQNIILRKYEPSCIFCEETKNVVNFKGKNICRNCLDEIQGKPKEMNSIWKTLK